MDLPVFYQTAATISPILLGGTVLAFSRWPRPRRQWRERVRILFLVLPPLFVTLWSVRVLAGESQPETWRLPVLWLLQLQMLTGLAGLAGLGFATRSQHRSLTTAWRLKDKERRRERRLARSHNQPHEPDRTGPGGPAQSAACTTQPRTRPDETDPGATAKRHS